ncbi:origin recognition complex subunit 1 isoform X1 [Triplophysa rosa]|uniref:Origin recognition complex subunit 1 n=1 Tax=Triplophysa rosa TaxID=992332 RepID=A0A9W8C5C4_TRIRA|nr:origin recognition complex subunit 1 isoform X1 [Triplophysa rosa]XP_057194784.1 origin recognition complex subunit 1 isoform X1 [Triplophysa rosa]KAI7807329.1 putative origin recognition complex subunit 1 [Triplophysa rosa]
MSRYITRQRMRRIYRWNGEPVGEDRKLKRLYHESMTISVDGRTENATVSLGQYILIEGDYDDNPFVAQLLKLYYDDSGKKKTALVQWFVRMCEIPQNKRKLLGRDSHPQEIFYYRDRSCDNEVDAETILSAVQIEYVPPEAPFPEGKSKDILFVKLLWDTKAFRALSSEILQPPLSPKSPPSSSRGPPARVLPTPDLTVMKRAMSVPLTRGSMSTGKISLEAESLHSASKLSAAKALSAKRRSRATSGPHVRKKLDLCSLSKNMTRDDVLEEILDEPKGTGKTLTSKLNTSPTGRISISIRLTPLNEPISPAAQENDGESKLQPLGEPPLGTDRTPRKREATPRKASLRGQTTRTPSRRKDSTALKEPTLAALAEEDHEDSPVLTAATPRSKRKSAQVVSSRIRKQLNLLGNKGDLQSDGEDDDDDCFVPAKIDLQSSSDEEAEANIDSEDELVVKRRRGSWTPRSTEKTRTSARTPRKTPSKKTAPATPRTPRTPRHATPSIPSRSAPARKPGNVLEEARARLHVSSVPESLPCREQEFQDIYNFVESKVIDGTGGCMYISGVPGTGKTATVHEVIRSLHQASEQDEIPQFRFIEINGMKMTDPHQAYVQILQKLTDQKATPDHAAALLEKRFSAPAPKKETTVLLVDELDLLWTRKQNVMYNLFDWPTRRNARLVVLTIANTMDLPERIMINRVASRLGLTRMSFQPYTFKQLQQIITSRLNRLKAFEEDALQLVSRKVAALSGDARRCLDICRRATEICEHSAGLQKGSGLVGMSHVMETLDEMFSSSYVTAIRCASLQEQLFLRAVIAEFRRLGLEEATFQQVFVQHQALCRVEGLQPASVSEGLAVCQRLGSCRLLLLEGSRLDLLLRIRLNVSQDDVLYALKAD